jgi:transcriptional regulator with XRE-family HTH domain
MTDQRVKGSRAYNRRRAAWKKRKKGVSRSWEPDSPGTCLNTRPIRSSFLGMTYKEVYERSGISISMLSRIVNRNRLPSLETVARLSGAIGKPIDEIMAYLGLEIYEGEVAEVGRGGYIRVTPTEYLVGSARFARMRHVLGVLRREFIEGRRRSSSVNAVVKELTDAVEFQKTVSTITAAYDNGYPKKWANVMAERSDVSACVNAYLQWRSHFVKKMVWIDRVSWSESLKVAGTVPRVCVLKGDEKPSIVTIVTGPLTDVTGVRIFGYRNLYNDRLYLNDKAERCVAVHVPRASPGERNAREYFERGEWEDKFIGACRDFWDMGSFIEI